MSKEELLKEIEIIIAEIETRLEAGNTIIVQCRRQMSVLKKKLKEYKQLEYKVSNSAVDGDL